MLASDSFVTTSEDANAVGNIYYAQYFTWQARLLETFLHTAAPRALRDAGGGELVCRKSRVDFLREAMPFDRLQVTMAVERLHQRGGVLRFEYFLIGPDGGRSKLSVGQLDVSWARRGADGRLQAAAWPEDVREVLEGRAAGTRVPAGATPAWSS
jgi:acyl-CoA thioesterase FadM